MAIQKRLKGSVPLIQYGFMVGLGVMTLSLYVLEWMAPVHMGPSKRENTHINQSLNPEICDNGADAFEGSHSLLMPRLFLKNLPSSLGTFQHVNAKRKTLADALVPHILRHNERVMESRAMLNSLQKRQDAGIPLTPDDRRFLTDLSLEYKMRTVSIPDLLKRVDIIPVSLALSQAVLESGWGGCRHARSQNSPFGMMKTATKLIQYDSLGASVSGYIHNLNTHPAYSSMRQIRFDMRRRNEDLCSLRLADGLLRYSELGAAYITKIKRLIREHNLKEYDAARLENHPSNGPALTA